MLNVEHVLLRNNIRMTNIAFAVADASNLVRYSTDPLYTATKLFNDVLSVAVVFKEAVHARIACKHMIRDVLVYKCKIDNDDIPDIVEDAVDYAEKFCAKPNNQYLLATPEVKISVVETAQVVDGIERKVAVNTNGSIKRGGKQILAADLYDKFIKNSTTPMSNKEFIQKLMDELDTTKLGANTYAYKLRKANKNIGSTPHN